VERSAAHPLVSSHQIGQEEHELLLLMGARLVQWADDLAHRAGDRFQPGVSAGTAAWQMILPRPSKPWRRCWPRPNKNSTTCDRP
jgi:hypothetical protein